jgi:hypothetical protein
MSHESPGRGEPLEYSPRDEAGSQGGKVGKGFAIGVIAALLGVPAVAMIGGWLDQRANPGAELAGLAGLFFGGIVGLAALAVGAVVAFVVGRRRNKPILRGAALGMLVATGVAGIAFGICAAVA